MNVWGCVFACWGPLSLHAWVAVCVVVARQETHKLRLIRLLMRVSSCFLLCVCLSVFMLMLVCLSMRFLHFYVHVCVIFFVPNEAWATSRLRNGKQSHICKRVPLYMYIFVRAFVHVYVYACMNICESCEPRLRNRETELVESPTFVVSLLCM